MTLWYYNILYTSDMTYVSVCSSKYLQSMQQEDPVPTSTFALSAGSCNLGMASSQSWQLPDASGANHWAGFEGRGMSSGPRFASGSAGSAGDQADKQITSPCKRPLYPRSVWHSAHRWPGVGPRWFSMDIFCGSPNWTHVAHDGTCEWSPRALGRRWKQTHVVQGDSTRTIRLTAHWSNLQRLEANPLMVRMRDQSLVRPQVDDRKTNGLMCFLGRRLLFLVLRLPAVPFSSVFG